MSVLDSMPPPPARTADRTLRVVLVGRDPALRSGVHAAFGGERGIALVAAAECGRMLPLIRESVADVVLVDFDGPGGAAAETCRVLTRSAPLTPLVAVVTGTGQRDDGHRLRTALAAGVRGYVSTSAGPAELVGATRAVAEGAMYLGRGTAWLLPGLLNGTPARAGHDILSVLTRREREILELVARGYDNRRIAQALHLADKTVRNHVSSVFGKLGVTRRAEAVVLARESGLGLT